MITKMDDEIYMKQALELAARGEGWTSPNPLVGAVIVKDGRIIGEGWHHKYGDLHAERDALKNCIEDPAGATAYVTLEPCCHYGKQPPCTDALIEAGIKRVVTGSRDPNPLVAGKGIRILKEHGIEVVEAVLEEQCSNINEVFFHYIREGIPFVAMKYAMTMDGKIACYTGRSKWITGEAAREHVQTLRNRYRGIMAGVGTVLADDPMLNCRMKGGRSPVRIICDSNLRTPLDSQIVSSAGEYETIIATCVDDPNRIKPYEAAGISVIYAGRKGMAKALDLGVGKGIIAAVGLKEGKNIAAVNDPGKEEKETAGMKVDLDILMKELGRRKIDSILLEGGSQLNWSVIRAGYVNRIYAYISPKIFGGFAAKTPIAGQGYPDPEYADRFVIDKVIRLGDDILIESIPY